MDLGKSSKSSLENRRNRAITLQILAVFITFIGIFWGISDNSFIIYGASALVGLSAFWIGFFQRKKVSKISETFLINANQFLMLYQPRILHPILMLLITVLIA